MKRYAVSIGRQVNDKYSKREDGLRYQYKGRTDNPDEYIREHTGKSKLGFQIRDSLTGEIVYKE